MKSKNLNNSSKKTRKLIKKTFAEMLGEKKELGKISVSELCKRAEISRGAFYSHYDDIYSVAEDYENELIENFFDNAKLIKIDGSDEFIDVFFDYIRENNENYRLLCKSNDLLFAAKKLSKIAANKFYEICNNSNRIRNKNFLQEEINIFIEGLGCEYIKYYRGYSEVSLETLYNYTKYWAKNFVQNRS